MIRANHLFIVLLIGIAFGGLANIAVGQSSYDPLDFLSPAQKLRRQQRLQQEQAAAQKQSTTQNGKSDQSTLPPPSDPRFPTRDAFGRPVRGGSSTAVLPKQRPAAGQKGTQRFVEIEITGQMKNQLGTTQRWFELLNEVGADRVRARSGRYAPNAEIEEIKLGNTVTVVVQGAISRQDLILPGGVYKLTDKARLTDFVRKLKDDGAKVTLADKKAFGLTSEQLVEIHGKMRTQINVQTKGASTGAAVAKMMQGIDNEFVLSPQARKMLGSREVVAEELNGMSTGTALAAAVRPLGLVIEPRRKQGEDVKIHIVDTRESAENWPVGWPIDKPLDMVEPKMFQRFELRINGYPLQKVLDAVEKRVGVPFLYDHNSIARAEIDTATTKVSLNEKKVAYMVAVRRLLAQTKPRLTPELRIDENGKTFLWISTE